MVLFAYWCYRFNSCQSCTILATCAPFLFSILSDAALIQRRVMRDTAGMRSKLMSKQSPPRKSHLQVLFINDTSRNGGPGRTLLDILKFLDATCVSRSVLIPHEGIVSQRLIDAKVVEELSFEPRLIEN